MSSSLTQERIPTILGHINIHRTKIQDNKQTMVFWPSLIMTGEMWYKQVDHFAPTHNCICIDSPGHGKSDKLQRHFTLVECAVVLRQIIDKLHIQKIILVGNSWGGMMGAVFAAVYPDHTAAAVLMNSSSSPPSLYQAANFYVLSTILYYYGAIPQFMVNGPVVESFTGPTTRKARPHVVEYIKKTAMTNDAKSIAYAIESVVPKRQDHRQLLRAIASPVLVLAGKEDAVFPNPESKAQADAIPGSTFKVLDGVAHLIALEDPDRINKEIEQFISKIQ